MSSARRAWERFGAGRSDVDFVAIVDGDCRATELGSGFERCMSAAGCRRCPGHGRARRWPLVCNGIYLRPGDLSRSPREVTPLAGHVTGRFRAASREGST